jgi:(p)ppGpp synthase/HD superfamily hydrolase
MGRKINSILTHQYTLALVYCAEIHAGQRRKGNATPYLAHLLSVSALVLEDGGDETEAIAALLHDSLEDQPDRTSREEIRQRFGEGAAQLVVACTDTPVDYHGGPKPPWRERKEKYLQHIRDGAGGAQRIVLADKLHNLRTMLADYRRVGEDLWPVFNAGKADQLWLYQSLVAAFAQAGAQGSLYDEFTRAVAELVHLTSTHDFFS